MGEDEIVAKLRERVPVVQETVPVIEPLTERSDNSQPVTIDIDDITFIDLHRFFGHEYKAYDQESKKQISYIYEKVAQEINTIEYNSVLPAIQRLQGRLGLVHDNNRLYKTYQWLKLHNVRQGIEARMETLSGA